MATATPPSPALLPPQNTFPFSGKVPKTCFHCLAKRSAKPKPAGRRATATLELPAGKKRAEQSDAEWSKTPQTCFHSMETCFDDADKVAPIDCCRQQSIQPFDLSTSQPFNPHLVTCHLAFGLTLPRRLRTILPVARHALPLRPHNTATLGNKRNSQCFSPILIACPLVPTKNPKPKGKP